MNAGRAGGADASSPLSALDVTANEALERHQSGDRRTAREIAGGRAARKARAKIRDDGDAGKGNAEAPGEYRLGNDGNAKEIGSEQPRHLDFGGRFKTRYSWVA